MLEEKAQNLIGDVSSLLPLIVGNTLNALAAILILLIGLWLSGRADRLVMRMLQRTPHVDPMLQSFFGSISRYLVLTVTVLAVLSEFGIQTTSLVAILGAASLAVGLALQGTLSNLAAGVLLLIFRPFRIGQKVQIGAGNVGTVKELTLFWTELITDDKVQVIVPNSGVWGQPLRNFSIYPAPPHATEVRFQIAADTELDPAVEQVRTLVRADPRVLGDPVPSVLLDRRAVDTLKIVAAFSTADDVAPLVKSDLIKAVHTALDAQPGQQSAQPA